MKKKKRYRKDSPLHMLLMVLYDGGALAKMIGQALHEYGYTAADLWEENRKSHLPDVGFINVSNVLRDIESGFATNTLSFADVVELVEACRRKP